MYLSLHRLKESEDRMKASVTSALNSTIVLAVTFLLILLFGIVLARG